jgi:hypothetical protein
MTRGPSKNAWAFFVLGENQMAIAEFNELCKDTFNTEERARIERVAEGMFKNNGVRTYLPLGKKEVCLERASVRDKTIEVFLMNGTLEMNNELVTRFNKRKRNEAGSQ